MVVNNYSQLQAFVAANPGAISSTGGFIPNATTAGDEWWETVYLFWVNKDILNKKHTKGQWLI
jgi:hypothetical protein